MVGGVVKENGSCSFAAGEAFYLRKRAETLRWDRRIQPRDVLFWWQKRTRKPPAISTRWIHEKGAARPF